MKFECPRCTGRGHAAEIDASGRSVARNLTKEQLAAFIIHYRTREMKYTQEVLEGLVTSFSPEPEEKKRDRLWEYITRVMRRGSRSPINPSDPAIQGEVGAIDHREMERLVDLLKPDYIKSWKRQPDGQLMLDISGPISGIQTGEAYLDDE